VIISSQLLRGLAVDGIVQTVQHPSVYSMCPFQLAGTKAQTRLEIARLTSVLQDLQDRDKEPAVTAIQADKERDQQGYLLASLWKWRRQRQAAIQRELRRLRKVVGEDAAAAVSGKGASGRAFEEADGGEGLPPPKTEL